MNNPVNLVDPDGRKIVDKNGNEIEIKIDGKGTLSFSDNATDDVKRISGALMLSETGGKMLNKLISSSSLISMDLVKGDKLVSETRKKVSGGEIITRKYHLGETTINNYEINSEGNVVVNSGNITIYEGSITKSMNQPEYTGLSLEQIIGAVAGHETVHMTNKKVITNTIKNPSYDAEAKANKIKNKILDEYRR